MWHKKPLFHISKILTLDSGLSGLRWTRIELRSDLITIWDSISDSDTSILNIWSFLKEKHLQIVEKSKLHDMPPQKSA